MPWTDFDMASLPRLGKTLRRLEPAPTFGLQSVSWTPRVRTATAPLRKALAQGRERHVVATGPTTAFWGGKLRAFVERSLRRLDTDYLMIRYNAAPPGAERDIFPHRPPR